MDSEASPKDTGLATETNDIASLKGQIDNDLLELGGIEHKVVPNHEGAGPDFGNVQSKLDSLVPKVQAMGKDAIPFFLDKIQQPTEADTHANLQKDIINNPHVANTERIHRQYPAYFIDGHADVTDTDQVLEALGSDTILHSNDIEAAIVLLDTTQRLVFPFRELLADGKIQPDNPYLTSVTDRLIQMYESNLPNGGRTDASISNKLLETIALTGTPQGRAFVEEHRRNNASESYAYKQIDKMLRFQDVSWGDMRQYAFDPELNWAGLSQGRLKTPSVSEVTIKELQMQAKEVAGLPGDELVETGAEAATHVEPVVEEPENTVEEIAGIQSELEQEFSSNDVTAAPIDAAPLPPQEDLTIPVVDEPVTRRKVLRGFAGGVLAAFGLAQKVAAPGTGRVENTLRAISDADEEIPSTNLPEQSLPQAPEGINIPPQPAPKEQEEPSQPESTQEQTQLDTAPEVTSEPDAIEPTPESSPQVESQPIPDQSGLSTAPEVTGEPDYSGAAPAEMPEPLEPDMLSGREPNVGINELGDDSETLDELLEGSATISIGEGDGTISEIAWREAKQNEEWWEKRYWYEPNNMGAFTLANYNELKDSYEARLDEIPTDERFLDGYPTHETILRWTKESKNELMKLGMSSPTSESIQRLKDNMSPSDIAEQLPALDNLWRASWWVREGDTFTLPRLEDSQKILDTFKK